MLALLRRNLHFFVALLLLMAVVGGLMLRYTKRDLIMWVNAHNTPAADGFFQYYTHVGDGASFIVLIVALFWLSGWRLAAVALASFAVSGLSSMGLKRYAFPHRLRPIKFFEQNPWEYHLIKGLHIHEYNSFPSGHTTTAFAMFTFLALATPRKEFGPLWVLLAGLVGYSRVYLFQHFVEDTFAGAVLGVVSAVVVWLLFNRVANQRKRP